MSSNQATKQYLVVTIIVFFFLVASAFGSLRHVNLEVFNTTTKTKRLSAHCSKALGDTATARAVAENKSRQGRVGSK